MCLLVCIPQCCLGNERLHIALDFTLLYCCGACTSCAQVVITISSKTGRFPPLDQKVKEAVRAGITVVVAGGNDGDDACKYSPGTSSDVITVGECYCTVHTLVRWYA